MTEYLYDGFHKIEKVQTEIKGKIVTREKLILKGAVGGCVIDDLGRMALVTQFRPTANFVSKEIPSGVLDKPLLTPIETLVEELQEECEIPKEDITVAYSTPFEEFFINIGSSDAIITIHEVFVKAQKQRVKLVQDADVESVEWAYLETVEGYIKRGLIKDPKTLLAYHYAKEKGYLVNYVE